MNVKESRNNKNNLPSSITAATASSVCKLKQITVESKTVTSIQQDKLFPDTIINNKILEKIIFSIKKNYEQLIMEKRYPISRLKDDISKIITQSSKNNLTWGNYNTTFKNADKKFEELLSKMISKPGVVDLNKIHNLISTTIPKTKDEQSLNFPKSDISANQIKTVIEKKDDWGYMVKKDYEDFKINQELTKLNKIDKILSFKESLDNQIKLKKEKEKELSQIKKAEDDKILQLAKKETEEEKRNRDNRLKEQIKQRKIYEETIKNRQEQKIKTINEKKKDEMKVKEDAETEIMKEKLKKQENKQKHLTHWKEAEEENKIFIEEKKKLQLEKNKEDIKYLKQFEETLNKQEETRKQDKEKRISSITKKLNVIGKTMEENNQRQKEIMDKIYQNDIIMLKEKEIKIQREESIKKEKKLNSLREGLKKQIEEKKKNKDDSRNKELNYFKDTILKSVEEYSKTQEKLELEKFKKMENYKKDLDYQTEKQVKEKEAKYAMNEVERKINKINL